MYVVGIRPIQMRIEAMQHSLLNVVGIQCVTASSISQLADAKFALLYKTKPNFEPKKKA